MDSGMMTARRRNLTLAVFNDTKASNKKDQPYDNKQNIYYLYTTLGKLPYYNNNILNTTLTCSGVCVPEPPQMICLISPIVLMGLDSILSLCASGGGGTLGPSKIAFILYTYWFGVTTGYNWMAGGPISGIKDNWNWSTRHMISDQMEQFLFMNSVLLSILPNIFTNAFALGATYDPTPLLNYAYTVLEYTPEQYTHAANTVTGQYHFNEWQSEFNAWFTQRNNEAKTIAAQAPTISNLPNGAHSVNAANGTVDPISGFPSPTKWTPITLPPPSNARKNYYTWHWQNITSPSGLTPQQTNDISGVADQHYIPDGPDRDAEIDALKNLTANLTDNQKSIAEFWAGITNTVNPPGIMFWFWKQYMQGYNIATVNGNTTFVYSGFHLATGLVEVGRMCWGLKYKHFQDRPIQEIRRRYTGQQITSWNGTVLGDNWIPYQPYNFITPPFPDFPSGHSAFSQMFANVMTSWFGATIQNHPVQTLTDLQLISPAFTGVTQTQPFGTIVYPKGKSQVVTDGSTPANDETLSWASWQDLADQAGLSRRCGGIHALYAHVGSQALANALYPVMNSIWGLPD